MPRPNRVHLRERARHVLAHALLRDVGSRFAIAWTMRV
jgi:hypothetical protein